MTLVARAVAPAPFDATPEAPRVRPSWQLVSRGLAAFHATSSTSTARSGWLPRPTTTRTSPCSAAWDRGSGGDQALGCPSLMTTERNHMPHARVSARHHSDSMRWRRHVKSAKRGRPFDDADRTTRSWLSDPRTRCHPLCAPTARRDVDQSPGAWRGRPGVHRCLVRSLRARLLRHLPSTGATTLSAYSASRPTERGRGRTMTKGHRA